MVIHPFEIDRKGAGRWPTAEAVFADILSIARSEVEVADPGSPRLECAP